MLERLLGLETEYAIRYSGSGPRPEHNEVFEALVATLEQDLALLDGERKVTRQQRFLQNGGAIYYEYLPRAPGGGLIEASTPECRGPSQLLLYQRAQERLLNEALPGTMERLRARGFAGELGLLKNCRDAQGNIYGAQENYEVEIARGAMLGCYRFGLALLCPLVVLSGAACVALTLPLVLAYALPTVAVVLLATIYGLLVPRHSGLADRCIELGTSGFRLLERLGTGIGIVGTSVGMGLYSLLFRACCCRAIRRDALAFFVSRPLLTGTGTLTTGDAGEHFGLSEKGPAIRSQVRSSALPSDRAVFDIGNLLKQLYSVLDLRLWPLGRLFRRRQRLQFGMSDSNCTQEAEYLGFATTSLVLDMAEAGALRELPRLRRPIPALHRLCADPSAQTKVACSDGVERSSLELQQLYLAAAERFVAASPAPALEARELLRIWAEHLELLSSDPEALFGRLDWVTKRALLGSAGAGLDSAARKKIDLKYHELGEGYLAQLEAEGLAPRLVDETELRDAMLRAPPDTPARRRSQLIQRLAAEGVSARVSWSRVEIRRGLLRRDVIHLDDYRS